MRSSRTRSLLVSAFVLVLAGIGWFYLAPTQIGGSTTYVITHGISMEPRIHTGDLVLVRPESNYRVGQVVAYHSTLLHTVVLHRIIGITHGHYAFKGDNNQFIDPTHPTRALLIGSMWLHVAGGGVILDWLHRPWVVAVLLGAVAAFLLLGGEQRRRRRRDRGRRQGSNGRRARTALPMTSDAPQSARRLSNRERFVACTTGAVICAVLCVVAFVLPATKTVVVRQPYTQTLGFSYRAKVKPNVVYPSGTVSTGDPVYIQLVHLLTVTAGYRLITAAQNRLHGTIGIRGTLSNTSGWNRSFSLAPPTRFVGATARSTAQINLTRLESLANRISAQIGAGSTSSYTLTVTPAVRVAGTIAGQPLSTNYNPTLTLALGAQQLVAGSSAIGPSGSTASSQLGLIHSTPGAATTVHSSTNTIAGVPVQAVRWLALVALALCGWGAWRFHQRELENPPDPAERVKSRYKHLIVPVEPFTPDPEHPPIDVSSIEALAQLAERSERLILHDRQEDVDNYLVDDQGTLYRFSAPRERDTPSEPTDPAAEAAAAILSSAAAKLAAAAKATTEAASAADTTDAPDRRSGGDRRNAADRRTGAGAGAGRRDAADRRGAGDRRAGPDRPAPGDQAATADRPQATHPPAAAASATQDDAAPPAGRVAGPDPVSEPEQPAETTLLSGRSRPHFVVLDADWQPPIPASTHWLSRPEVRAGFAIGPLALTFLAWRRVRARRRRMRGDDAKERQARRSWTTRNLGRR